MTHPKHLYSLLFTFLMPLAAGAGSIANAATAGPARITIQEFPIQYPSKTQEYGGSTHEITYGQNGTFWISGQNYDEVVEMDLHGNMTFHQMPKGSGPHGIDFDAANQLWLTLEFAGKIVRLDASGKIAAQYDVSLHCTTSKAPINTHPHGLGIGPDGKTVWFTGKSTGTIGKLTPDGKVQTFAIPTVGSVPIYIKAGPDGNMWFTELVGNMIGRITPDGAITEFAIPTPNSGPIAIIPEPGGKAMWFTEEAGNKIGRVDMSGKITEFPVPMTGSDVILAALAFDSKNNLWVQQYVNCGSSCASSTGGAMSSNPAEPDYVLKFDKSIRQATSSNISNVPVTYCEVPTRKTVMHRIILGPDRNMWFTELNADKVGKVPLNYPPAS